MAGTAEASRPLTTTVGCMLDGCQRRVLEDHLPRSKGLQEDNKTLSVLMPAVVNAASSFGLAAAVNDVTACSRAAVALTHSLKPRG